MKLPEINTIDRCDVPTYNCRLPLSSIQTLGFYRNALLPDVCHLTLPQWIYYNRDVRICICIYEVSPAAPSVVSMLQFTSAFTDIISFNPPNVLMLAHSHDLLHKIIPSCQSFLYSPSTLMFSTELKNFGLWSKFLLIASESKLCRVMHWARRDVQCLGVCSLHRLKSLLSQEKTE